MNTGASYQKYFAVLFCLCFFPLKSAEYTPTPRQSLEEKEIESLLIDFQKDELAAVRLVVELDKIPVAKSYIPKNTAHMYASEIVRIVANRLTAALRALEGIKSSASNSPEEDHYCSAHTPLTVEFYQEICRRIESLERRVQDIYHQESPHRTVVKEAFMYCNFNPISRRTFTPR